MAVHRSTNTRLLSSRLYAATRYVSEHAEEFEVDSTRLAVAVRRRLGVFPQAVRGWSRDRCHAVQRRHSRFRAAQQDRKSCTFGRQCYKPQKFSRAYLLSDPARLAPECYRKAYC